MSTTQSVTTSQANTAIFLSLPAEIRNVICEQVHQETLGEDIRIIRPPSCCRSLAAVHERYAAGMGLLGICHQIRKEGSELAYSTVHVGIFLTSPDGWTYRTDYIFRELEMFKKAYDIDKLRSVQYLDLGVQDISPYVPGSPTIAEVVNGLPALRHPPKPARGIGMTARDDRVMIAELSKQYSKVLPNVRVITLHDTVQDQLAVRKSLLRRLTELFPKVGELRVLKVGGTKMQPVCELKRYKVANSHMYSWEDGKDLGKLLVNQMYY